MHHLKLNTIGLLLLITTIGCTDLDDKDIMQESTASLTLQFDNRVLQKDLVLNDERYRNERNETYTVTELKYIISTITLTDDEGALFAYPKEDSFFVIDENDPASLKVSLKTIPDGVYTKLQFGLGVDQSNYPLEGANFVPQAEEKGMIWSWTTGFKFLKFEGTFIPDGETATANFLMHMGSDGINQDNYQTITINLGTPLEIVEGKSATLALEANVAIILDGLTSISIADQPEIQIDPIKAPLIAQNCSALFSLAQ